ncbi:MAG: hypothetical protein ACREA0_05520 [bacterium]
MKKLRLSLVENALDFFSEAIACLEKDRSGKLKYAVLHVASAVELILKARLGREHWALMFREPARAEYRSFERGDFRSADFVDTQQRLETICGVDLTKHRSLLNPLRDMRNRLQHFAFSGDVPEIRSVVTRTWSFLWDFIHDEMPDQVADHRDTLEEFRDRMTKHEEHVRARLTDIEPDLDRLRVDGIVVVSCPSCLQEALVLPGGEDPSCRFCRYEQDPLHVADDWASVFVGYPHTDPKERLIEPVLKECVECGRETMIEFEDGSMTPPDPAWICFSCGQSGSPTVRCRACGEEFPWEEDEVYVCPECRGENT